MTALEGEVDEGAVVKVWIRGRLGRGTFRKESATTHGISIRMYVKSAAHILHSPSDQLGDWIGQPLMLRSSFGWYMLVFCT